MAAKWRLLYLSATLVRWPPIFFHQELPLWWNHEQENFIKILYWGFFFKACISQSLAIAQHVKLSSFSVLVYNTFSNITVTMVSLCQHHKGMLLSCLYLYHKVKIFHSLWLSYNIKNCLVFPFLYILQIIVGSHKYWLPLIIMKVLYLTF